MPAHRSTSLGHAPQIALNATKQSIDDGIERNSNHCVVADAIKVLYPKFTHIAVDIQTIRASDKKKGERYIWITPRKIQKFIIDFDRGDKANLKPFTATLKIGQTIPMGHMGQKERKAKRAANAVARLRVAKSGRSSPPVVSGGRAPPVGAGARRQFGLRGLEY